MIGTVFLWMYWPSFNGALAGDNGNARHRCIINTTLSISSSAFWAFVVSRLLRPDGKFNMVDVQNATLAGGVAMGCSSNMLTSPWGAMFIGSWAGILSTVGFNKIQPYIAAKLDIHDTCGVHNLHGMPSVWGAFCSVVVTAVRTHADCEFCTSTICPCISRFVTDGGDTGYAYVYPLGANRTPQTQALYQLLSIAVTLGWSHHAFPYLA